MNPSDTSIIDALHARFGGELVDGCLRLVVAGRPLLVACETRRKRARLDVACEALPAGLAIRAETWLSRLVQSVGGPDLQLGMGALDDALHIDGERDGLLAVLEEGVPQRLADLVERRALRLDGARVTAEVGAPEEAEEVVQLAIDLCDPGVERTKTLAHTMQWSSEPALRWAAWLRMRGLDPEAASAEVDAVVAGVVKSRDSELIGRLMSHVAQSDDPEEITALVRAFPSVGPAWLGATLRMLLSDRAMVRMVEALSGMEPGRRVAALAAIGAIAEPALIPMLRGWGATDAGQELRSMVDAAITQIEARAAGGDGRLTLVEEDDQRGQLSVAAEAGSLAMADEDVGPGGAAEAGQEEETCAQG